MVGTLNGVFQAPSGITFDAGSNTLSSYVSSTFTPVLSFGGASVGITYTTQIGTWQRVGGMVFINVKILLSSKGSSTGASSFSGLPFTSRNDGSNHRLFMTFVPVATLTLETYYWGDIAANSAVLTPTVGFAASGSSAVLSNNEFTNTAALTINGFYFI